MEKRTEGVCWIFLNIGGHFVEYSAEGWMAERTQSQTFAQYIRTRSKVQLQLRDDIRPRVYKSGIFQERFILCFARAKSLFSEVWSTLYLHTQGKLWVSSISFSSVQFSSVAQSCLTLCDPMNRSTPGLPVHHQLLEFTQTYVHWVHDAIQPSHPLSSPFPALNLSQHQGLYKWISSSRQVAKVLSLSFNISPSNEHPGLISFRMDWLDLLAVQGTLKSLLQHHSSKASILLRSAFFTVQLSHLYLTTGKTIALTRQTVVGKVMSLLLNMLSRLVITILPRSKRLLISWLQSPSSFT